MGGIENKGGGCDLRLSPEWINLQFNKENRLTTSIDSVTTQLTDQISQINI